jgi:hypothetical protein
MLGFVCSWPPYSDWVEEEPESLFVSTTKFVAFIPDDDIKYDVLDCRHGHVFLGDKGVATKALAVWDPMTGCQWSSTRPRATTMTIWPQ